MGSELGMLLKHWLSKNYSGLYRFYTVKCSLILMTFLAVDGISCITTNRRNDTVVNIMNDKYN